MNKKLNLSKPIACICEGKAEKAVMDILLNNHLLIFSREDLLDHKLLTCRNAKKFQDLYLKMNYKNKISVIRILDSRMENFILSKAYKNKVDVIINVLTTPEIEILIIYSEGKYQEFHQSRKKPSDFCMQNLIELDYRKSYENITGYFNDPDKLVGAIETYHNKRQNKNEYSLWNLLK